MSEKEKVLDLDSINSPKEGTIGSNESQEDGIRWGVFIPGILFMGVAVILGIFNSNLLSSIATNFFNWSLDNFGWLYQLASILAFIIVLVITFSKFGNIRFGGKDAKPKYSFMTWFAMALTGGIATGIVNWGVNEPLIYFGNVYGELNQLGIEPNTSGAAIFSIARCFYNWTFIPYAIYSVAGLAVAYNYFNKKEKLTVTATLKPLFGERITKGVLAEVIDTLCMLAITLGLASGLGTGLALVASGLELTYGIPKTLIVWLVIGGLTTIIFTGASYLGIDKGIKVLATWNSKIFYILLIILFFTGPMVYILRISTAGMAEWLHNFWRWGLDPIDIGGAALTRSWTLFDWSVWIAYAPLMGLFLAMISYGRTIREFMIINWIMPSIFGLIWFSIWGGTAINWQLTGKVDLINTLQTHGAVAGLWQFLNNFPFKMGVVIIPIIMITLIISFATAADAMTTTIASMCMKNIAIGEEPPALQKILWGLIIGSISIIMAAFGGGEQGVEGVKALAAAGGFAVLFIFMLQLISIIKMFFIDKIEE